MFDNDALTYLKLCKDRVSKLPKVVKESAWLGADAKKWFEHTKSDWQLPGLSSSKLYRDDLIRAINGAKKKRFLSQSDVRELTIKVFVWGGMTRTHNSGKLAMETINSYEDICRDLLDGLDPASAYERFYMVHNVGEMKGVGPAYYTKLICFLGDQSGVIMDQWTARSINVLFASDIIRLNKSGKSYTVNKKNTSHVYSSFLSCIRKLQIELKIESALETEELIFSCSDMKKPKPITLEHHKILSAWRRYVKTNETINI